MFAGSFLKKYGYKKSFRCSGLDGLDEVTITGETRVAELKDGIFEHIISIRWTISAGSSRWNPFARRSNCKTHKITRNVLLFRGKNGAPVATLFD